MLAVVIHTRELAGGVRGGFWGARPCLEGNHQPLLCLIVLPFHKFSTMDFRLRSEESRDVGLSGWREVGYGYPVCLWLCVAINCFTKHARSCFIHVRKIDLKLFRRARAAKRARKYSPWRESPERPTSPAVSLLVCRRHKVLFDQRES